MEALQRGEDIQRRVGAKTDVESMKKSDDIVDKDSSCACRLSLIRAFLIALIIAVVTVGSRLF